MQEVYPWNLVPKGKFLVHTKCKESDRWRIYLEISKSKKYFQRPDKLVRQ